MKNPAFSRTTSMLKHYREVGSDRKRSYIRAFPRRYFKIRCYLEIARVLTYSPTNIKRMNRMLYKLQPDPAIIDDKMYNSVTYPKKVREGDVHKKHLKRLVLVADNLANYFRLVLENNPAMFREELGRFEK